MLRRCSLGFGSLALGVQAFITALGMSLFILAPIGYFAAPYLLDFVNATEAVKAEGGQQILDQVRAIVAAGIPYCGHLGMLPQHVKEEGGYRIKGRVQSERETLLADAQALSDAGAFALVLEIVVAPVAEEITGKIPIPTIGIGSGRIATSNLVTNDLLGTFVVHA
jgi:3-methyl-2-oxobutanoate hydroxymethyltransferase